MNHTRTDHEASRNTFTLALELLELVQFVDRSHILVATLFLFVLNQRVTFPPILIPAFFSAAYYEWSLYEHDGASTIKYTLSAIGISWIGTFAYRLVTRRLFFHNLPGVPHNFLFGHIPTMAKLAPKFPSDVHSHTLMNYASEQYDLADKYGLFYMDVYPVDSKKLLIVVSPEVAVQVAQTSTITFPKHPTLSTVYGPVLGRRGMVSLEGTQWKEVRTMFNPGFSQANLLSMVPTIVDETKIFESRLLRAAAGDGFVCGIEDYAAALTVDVIGQVVFGVKFNHQRQQNPMVHSIIELSKLVPEPSEFSPQRINVWLKLKKKYYESVVNTQVMNMLKARWSELADAPEKASRSNAIFDIAMATHMKRGGVLDTNVTQDFLELMRDNVKTFIFAGHDTTSSVLAYAFYEMSCHAQILTEVRAEHDNVLGSDPDQAAQRLKENPKLANLLPLTTAIVREVMRVHLPATGVRIGPPGSTLTGKDGKTYPAEGFLIWMNNNATMHDPTIFPKPYEFLPNRFLPDKSPFPSIPKNAYRPFEKGPRDCIGQELAMLESRVVLALILRKFDFEEAYNELDRRLGRKGKIFEGVKNCGGRAYQILWTTAKPKDGLPMWVKERR